MTKLTESNFTELCARVVRREFLPALDKCRTITDARREVSRMDNQHGWLGLELMKALDAERATTLEQAAKIETLTAQREQDERDHLQTIDKRDRWEDKLTELAQIAGCKEEWSNLHEHGDCIAERLREQAAKIEKLEKARREANRWLKIVNWT